MSSDRCPHCRTSVGATRARDGGYRCKLCGGPRVVADRGNIALSGREEPLLKEVRRAARARYLWLAGALVSAFAAAGALGLVVLAQWLLSNWLQPSTLESLLLFGFASLPLLFSAYGWRRALRAQGASAEALHQARLSAVRDLLEGGRELRDRDVTELLALRPAQSEALLAELNLDDSIMSTVTDAGDVTYRTANLRLRIEEAARAAGLSPAAEDEIGVAISDSLGADAPTQAPVPSASRRR